MASSESKIQKVQAHFQALSSVASSLNVASDEFTRTVCILDEALKKLNVGISAWVTFRSRGDEDEPYVYDDDQIGYCKVNGNWGLAFRRIWGDESRDRHSGDGPMLFNDASRELRLLGVDKLPELIEALGREAFETAKKVREKTNEVRELASVIERIANEPIAKAEAEPAAGLAQALKNERTLLENLAHLTGKGKEGSK